MQIWPVSRSKLLEFFSWVTGYVLAWKDCPEHGRLRKQEEGITRQIFCKQAIKDRQTVKERTSSRKSGMLKS